jgi:hypothetical protein
LARFPGGFFGKATSIEACGIPHLAKNERDAPNFLHANLDKTACAPFFKERRMKFAEPSKPHRKSGVWGTRGWWWGKTFEPRFSRLRRRRKLSCPYCQNCPLHESEPPLKLSVVLFSQIVCHFKVRHFKVVDGKQPFRVTNGLA